MKLSERILKHNPHLNEDGTHKNKNCLYFMSKPNACRINCTKKGFIYSENCTLDCKHKFEKI